MRGVGSVLMLAIGLCCTFACGGGDDDGESSPVEDCRDLRDTFCRRLVDCAVEDDRIDDSARQDEFEACVSGFETSLDCNAAVDVSDSFDECVSDLDDASCADYLAILDNPDAADPLPASCNDAVLTEP